MDGFYLSSAKMAMRYVQDKMDLGASNKFSDMLRTGTAVKFCTNEMRDNVDKELASYPDAKSVNSHNEREFNRRYLRANAEWARLYGCGNCGEQSALAFVYLENQK